jgi:hypothetical protein
MAAIPAFSPILDGTSIGWKFWHLLLLAKAWLQTKPEVVAGKQSMIRHTTNSRCHSVTRETAWRPTGR